LHNLKKIIFVTIFGELIAAFSNPPLAVEKIDKFMTEREVGVNILKHLLV
jgi:hypothetical protein